MGERACHEDSVREWDRYLFPLQMQPRVISKYYVHGNNIDHMVIQERAILD